MKSLNVQQVEQVSGGRRALAQAVVKAVKWAAKNGEAGVARPHDSSLRPKDQ